MVNNYSIYFFDIKQTGFAVIEIEDFSTEETVRKTREILADADRGQRMTEINYALCLKRYGYRPLQTKLRHIISTSWGTEVECPDDPAVLEADAPWPPHPSWPVRT